VSTGAGKSRRAVLTAAAGAVAATTVGAVARPIPALAAGDDFKIVHVGDLYQDVRSTTFLENGTNESQLLSLRSVVSPNHPNSGKGQALYAYSDLGIGIVCNSQDNIGLSVTSAASDAVSASSISGRGIHASGQTYGVYAEANDLNASGVLGKAINNGGIGVNGVANNDSSSTGVYGHSNPGIGVKGVSQSSFGVYGQSDTSYAVYGFNDSSGTAILGYGQNGEGVRGHTTGSTTPAIIGHAFANTTGVVGFSGGGTEPVVPKKTGVYGVAHQGGSSVGVRGDSSTGRGGMFSGKLAQLRLAPSRAATHPASGQPGDVFFDKGHRLWFCLGGTNWKRVQLV
jgi:hypothetical protein